MKYWLVALSVLIASPAFATSQIFCTDPNSDVSLTLSFGNVPVAAVISATISTPNGSLSTQMDDIIVGQDFFNQDQMLVDFVDPNVENIVAQLRLFSANENMKFALAGTLKVVGVGAFPLVCDGP